MTKPEGLSAEAAAASTEDELWGLFMTDEILDNIVRYTNDSIQEDMEQLQYSAERMNQSPYIKPIDKVTFFPPHFLSHSHATLPFVEGPVPTSTNLPPFILSIDTHLLHSTHCFNSCIPFPGTIS
jgi:hypothetical protein